MAGHSPSKTGVNGLSPGHQALATKERVDARHKAGHDVDGSALHTEHPVIASAAKQSRAAHRILDCFVAALLAMTAASPSLRAKRSNPEPRTGLWIASSP